ncbi:hypothetical protein [Fulvivirga lutimaris]|uniref:hypothetical protein n=1 Tax=Fulvivirga lutimaris TaxID=1819566 RepID=UPI0012BBCB9F|nr:hypothetical protein [Fulvivirga lutimaris]MTI40698.1 hypothetical protein [Fulvivirga lutimaris]
MEKKRVIKSLENLDPELKTLVKKAYPDGFEDHLIRLQNAKNEPFFCVRLETDDTMYLVKIAVTKNNDGGYDIDEDEDDDRDEDSNLDEASFDEDFDDD